MNYGFIGTGNIANAIVTGVLRRGNAKASQFYVFDANENTRAHFAASFGSNGCESAEEVIQKSDMVFLAVKPHVYPALLPSIGNALCRNASILVSLAAGQAIQKIEDMLNQSIPIIRVMPNMNAAICESVNALCANSRTTQAQKTLAMEFFSWTGMTMEIEEDDFGIFSAIAGCSPAYTYLYIDSLAKGAQKNGMNKKKALKIAAQAVLGSAKMLLENEEHPWALIDKVCSPGGVTIEGVCALEEYRFESAVVRAVDAAVHKDSKI